MRKQIDLMTESYDEGLKIILKQFDSFCETHELDTVDLDMNRNDHTIETIWRVHVESVDSLQELYDDFRAFKAVCKEDMELVQVEYDDDEYYGTYEIKRLYVLTSSFISLE